MIGHILYLICCAQYMVDQSATYATVCMCCLSACNVAKSVTTCSRPKPTAHACMHAVTLCCSAFLRMLFPYQRWRASSAFMHFPVSAVLAHALPLLECTTASWHSFVLSHQMLPSSCKGRYPYVAVHIDVKPPLKGEFTYLSLMRSSCLIE